jgi:MFS transporter, ACS family, hexuronate transporter
MMKGNYRYTILGLLFLASTINYIDRQIIGLLKPTLEKEFNWTEQDYANIVFWFQAMYAVGYMLSGRFVDRVGAKIGYGIAVLLWSLAAMAHAFAKSIFGFNVVRGALGFAEGGNFPAAIKSIAEWFPVKERSLASGIMISGTTVGPILAPGIVLWIADGYGWQMSFIITGAIGLAWLVAWYFLYSKPEQNKYVNASEVVYINAGAIEETKEKVPLKTLLSKKQTWGFFLATFLTDPVWWFYLFWLPSF